MEHLRFTARAESDLDSIGAYTLERWGVEQALRYLGDLEACCQRLAQDPTGGRVHAPRPQYWRFEQGKHVVFFRRETNGDVIIVRILHERMLPALHLNSDE